MKSIFLKSLELTNFKKFNSFFIEFSNVTEISGQNRTGKSTIFDAFTWLLFGKDSRGSANFSIKTLVDGNHVPQVPHGVKGIFLVNGKEVTFERVLVENWVKKSGEKNRVFEGNTTDYFVDNVPCKAGEYAAKVSEVLDESTFKLITNPRFFANLHWEKQREQLMIMAGEITKDEIIGNNEELRKFVERLNGQSLADFKKKISFKISELNKQIDIIPIQVAQTIKMRPEDKNWAEIEAKIASLDAEIKSIEESAANANTAAHEVNKRNALITEKIGKLELMKSQVLNARRLEASKAADKQNEKVNEYYAKKTVVEGKVSLLNLQLSNALGNLNSLISKREKLESERSVLREEFTKVNATKHIEKDGCLICPLFGHECTDDTAVKREGEAVQRAAAEFNRKKAEAITEIRNNGTAKSVEIADLEKSISGLNENISEIRSLIASESAALESVNALIKSFEVVKPVEISEDHEDIMNINLQIQELKNSYEVANYNIDNTAVSNLRNESNALRMELAVKSTIEKSIKEEDLLNEKLNALTAELSLLQGEQFMADQYESSEIREVESRVNSMFSVVKFNMFKFFQNGTSEPWCNITVNGIPYADVNTADQVNAGIDIINTLCSFYMASAPIFIDNAEGVNNILHTESQVIKLIVTNESLKIS